MIRGFLVDDEPLALRRLARMLEATGRVTVVGQETDPHAAIEAIRVASPPVELVFLDISMPELDGFGVCERLPRHVAVVFTTAHDEHALRAFTVAAIDYLLKPIRDDELHRALHKCARLRAAPDAEAQLAAAMSRIANAAPARIASRLGDRIHLVELDRVSHFFAEDKLTYAVTAERSYVVEPSISELETRHAGAGFFRIHRATLVRLASVVELHTTTDGTRVRLANGKELGVARERVRSLKERLGLA